MTAQELLTLLSKVWCTTDDLMKLSGLGYVKASNLKKEIRDELLSKRIDLPKGKIPMSEVVKKLNIDIEHYKKIAKYLGHAKIDETLNTYSHLFKNKMDEIVDLMNKMNS